MSLLEEIREQPEVLARAIESNIASARRVAELAADVSHVVIAARGTSDNAGRYAQYVWGSRNHLAVGLTTPSLFSVYDRPPSLAGSLVVGISQSGESPDIVSVLEEARRQERPTLAITNEPDSPLADVADVVIDLGAGVEAAVAATKTFTAELAVIATISEALSGRTLRSEPIAAMAGEALHRWEEIVSVVADLSELTHGAVLGRGVNFATAHEWALKMQELSYVVAQPFSTADFVHGPIAVVEPGYPVFAVAVTGPGLESVIEVLANTTRAGARLLAISNAPEVEQLTDSVIGFDSGVDEWLSPIPAIILAQQFTYQLTMAKGHDPESPRGLRKVTRTT